MAGQKSLQRPVPYEVAESCEVFGPRAALDEPNDRPGYVETRVRRAREVGDEENAPRPENAQGFSKHDRALVFRMFVQRKR